MDLSSRFTQVLIRVLTDYRSSVWSAEKQLMGFFRRPLEVSIFHDGELIEPLNYRVLFSRARDKQRFPCPIAHRFHQVDHPAFFISEEGERGNILPLFQWLHIVGGHTVQKINRILSAREQTAKSMRGVEEAGVHSNF